MHFYTAMNVTISKFNVVKQFTNFFFYFLHVSKDVNTLSSGALAPLSRSDPLSIVNISDTGND